MDPVKPTTSTTAASKEKPTPVSVPAKSPRRWPWSVRRMKRQFSVDRLRDTLATLALVIPMTLLIWIWAEREQVDEDTFRNVVLQVESALPNTAARITNPPGGLVTLTLQGPRSGLQQFRSMDQTLRVQLNGTEVGRFNIEVRSLLDAEPELKRAGLTVLGVEPDTISAEVEPIKTWSIEPTLDGLKTTSVTINPPKVSVVGPESRLNQLNSSGRLVAALEIAGRPELVNLPPGGSVTLNNVQIRPIEGVNFEPAIVDSVTLRLAVTEERHYEFPSILLRIAPPAGMLNRVRISDDTPKVLNNVDVVGPADVVARLEVGELNPPVALLLIDNNDLGKRITRMPIFENLPEGVRVENVDPINFRVDELEPGAGLTP